MDQYPAEVGAGSPLEASLDSAGQSHPAGTCRPAATAPRRAVVIVRRVGTQARTAEREGLTGGASGSVRDAFFCTRRRTLFRTRVAKSPQRCSLFATQKTRQGPAGSDRAGKGVRLMLQRIVRRAHLQPGLATVGLEIARRSAIDRRRSTAITGWLAATRAGLGTPGECAAAVHERALSPPGRLAVRCWPEREGQHSRPGRKYMFNMDSALRR